MAVDILLAIAGVFSLALGAVHFFLPALLDYRSVVLERVPDWKPRRPFRVWLTRYTVTLRDRYGIIWVRYPRLKPGVCLAAPPGTPHI